MQEPKEQEAHGTLAGSKSLLFFLKSDWAGLHRSVRTSAEDKQTLVDKACVRAEPVGRGENVNILQSKIHLLEIDPNRMNPLTQCRD